MAAAAREAVDVAVGVLVRRDGSFLLGSRPEGKPYAGYWEFPGGKLEPGESVNAALARELHEELGIRIGASHPWVTREFDYPHARVRLHFERVFDWEGEPHARENQAFGFFTVDRLPAGPLLPATIPVLRWLALPDLCGVSNAAALGVPAFLQRLERRLDEGLRFVLVREPALDERTVGSLVDAVLQRARTRSDVQVVVSSRHPRALWQAADGVHLTARDLATLTERPPVRWVGASCHASEELALAATRGCDYAVLGPVLPTASHPGEPTLGWEGFAERVRATAVPCYAIGGMTRELLATAVARGAHGVAMLSAAW